MKKTLHFHLKAGERIFVNGAVLRVDRKVAIEFLNDVTFLLDSHVLQSEDATTPLKQFYFMIQLKLTSPDDTAQINPMLRQALLDTMAAFDNGAVIAGLREVTSLMAEERYFECLKVLRRLFPIEEEILEQGRARPNLDNGPIQITGAVACK